ncbi:DUF935 family protein [uncultured Brachyspira sp.]|uniref:DUF935 domain-containing protein n=1 Tax=uncultured Brachyspira sp. TaxID=221953 RepID=UPI00258AA1C1|nr:DUF935 family protein [uncultured Brachyspira sp.]
MKIIDNIKNVFKNKKKLETEIAYSVPYSNRSVWSDFSLIQSLSPSSLSNILNDVKNGNIPSEYLELASDIELKDSHYRSVLNTRKLAVTSLDIKIIPASDEKKDIEISQAIERDIVKSKTAGIYSLIFDMLDAIAKGFSVNEIIWKSENNVWLPKEYKYRDAVFFSYDERGEKLKLRDIYSQELYDLPENKFIIHEPKNHSGVQILSGLAMPALFLFMLKYYDITSWAAFIDRFGYPIRIGKYGHKATEEDIITLKRAVSSIGSDFGAVIPENAILEIIESKTTQSTSDTYQKLAEFINKEISKLVLGQTMTSEEGSSYSQEQIHNEVRQDIANSDIRQIMETINSQLIVPYCNFNFGELANYPKLELFKPDIENVELIVNAVTNLADKGLKVKASEIRAMLGLSEPQKDDETIGGIIDNANFESKDYVQENNNKIVSLSNRQLSVNNESIYDESFQDDYIEIEDDIIKVLEDALNRCKDFEEMKKELDRLTLDWDMEKVSKLMAATFFISRAKGDNDFNKDEE